MNVLVNTYAGAVEGSLDVAALRTIMDVLVSSCPRCTRRQRERAGPDQATARHCRARKRDERLRAKPVRRGPSGCRLWCKDCGSARQQGGTPARRVPPAGAAKARRATNAGAMGVCVCEGSHFNRFLR